MVQSLYTPGNDLLKDAYPGRKDLLIRPNNALFSRLSPLSREALKFALDS
jgi:hypothetical protein